MSNTYILSPAIENTNRYKKGAECAHDRLRQSAQRGQAAYRLGLTHDRRTMEMPPSVITWRHFLRQKRCVYVIAQNRQRSPASGRFVWYGMGICCHSDRSLGRQTPAQ